MKIPRILLVVIALLAPASYGQDVIINTPNGPISVQYDQQQKQVVIKISVGNAPGPPIPPTPPGPSPNPPPNPTPPAPSPVFPAGQFGLAKVSYDAIANDGNMDKGQKAAVAGALEGTFEGIASKIMAVPTYTDMAIILADTKKSNDEAIGKLGIDRSLTLGAQTIIKQKVRDLYANGKLNTAADLAVAWREISQGLKKVRE